MRWVIIIETWYKGGRGPRAMRNPFRYVNSSPEVNCLAGDDVHPLFALAAALRVIEIVERQECGRWWS